MKRSILQSVFGPRVPRSELKRCPHCYLAPTVLFIAAAALLLASFFQQYWSMTLYAPQYPKGLHVQAHLNRLSGDVAEIDGLNHYIGMRPLEEAAQLERSLSFMAVIAFSLLVAGAIIVHSRWAALLVAPAMTFPAAFLLDLYFWLSHFGQNLDPKAALSSSIKPFTPPVLGEGVIGQFRTVAQVDSGWWMALAASALMLVGLYLHRRAYKPLFDAHASRPVPAVARPRSAGVRMSKHWTETLAR
jgi:copper chaperone NosL